MANKQRSIKRLEFGDRQNIIDHLIRTGVEHVLDTNDDDIQNDGNAEEVILIEGNDNNNTHESEVDDDVDVDKIDNNADVDELVNDDDNNNLN